MVSRSKQIQHEFYKHCLIYQDELIKMTKEERDRWRKQLLTELEARI